MPIDKVLLDRIKSDTSLTELDLSNRSLLSTDIEKLVALLQTNQTITKINLSNNHLGNKALIYLKNLLMNNKTISSIDLSTNQISHNDAFIIKEILISNTTLLELNLSNNQLSPKGVLPISEGLAINKTLLSLNLKGNRIKNGIKYLFSPLSNSPLKSLNLSGNDLENKDIRELPGCLSKNTNLETLDLSWNKLSSEVEHIMESIQINAASAIHTLVLNNNIICDSNCSKISNLWKEKGMKVKHLDLSENLIKEYGVNVLASALPYTKLSKLNLKAAQCRDESLKRIELALQKITPSNNEIQQRNLFVQGEKKTADNYGDLQFFSQANESPKKRASEQQEPSHKKQKLHS